MKCFSFLILLFTASCTASHDPMRDEVMNLVHSKKAEDTSYVYGLPFEKGKTFRVIQGYYSSFSHKNRAAIDFNMSPGTKIIAAREGIVVRVKEDGDRGGLNRKYRQYGNNIVIEHSDGSRAGYWHLRKDGAVVNAGDSVKKGELIGYSGKTGYAALPHLHFIVWRSGRKGNWQQIATRFQTADGIQYLKFLKKYKNDSTEN